MQTTRFKIAAATTLAALGILAALALSAGGQERTSTTATAPEEVRTEVVQETVHKTRRARNRGSGGVLRAAPAPAPRVPAPAPPVAAPFPAGSPDGHHRGRGPGEGDHDEFEDEHHAEDDHGHGRGRGRGRGGDDD